MSSRNERLTDQQRDGSLILKTLNLAKKNSNQIAPQP
jgi:pantothenate synthetase